MFDLSNLDFDEIVEKLKELILKKAIEAIPGKQKMREVVHEAADWLASKTPGPIPDAIEASFYRIGLAFLAQFAFKALRKLGKV